jgi:hypothetical protein
VDDVADLAVFHQFNAGFDNRMVTYKVLELASLLVEAG